MIVADAENLAIQNRLKEQFPLAEIVNPDPEFNFVNLSLSTSYFQFGRKLGLSETKTNLIISMVSMLNAQQNENRKTRLMTLDRSSAMMMKISINHILVICLLPMQKQSISIQLHLQVSMIAIRMLMVLCPHEKQFEDMS